MGAVTRHRSYLGYTGGSVRVIVLLFKQHRLLPLFIVIGVDLKIGVAILFVTNVRRNLVLYSSPVSPLLPVGTYMADRNYGCL